MVAAAPFDNGRKQFHLRGSMVLLFHSLLLVSDITRRSDTPAAVAKIQVVKQIGVLTPFSLADSATYAP